MLIKFATAFALTALIGIGLYVARIGSGPEPATGIASLPEKQATKDANESPDRAQLTFPDGLMHDFGIVRRGPRVECAFRIVNTSKAPVQIASVRASMAPLIARPTAWVLQPGDEAKLEISVDTRRFRGPKTSVVYLVTENGKEARFAVSANSQDDLLTKGMDWIRDAFPVR